MGTVYPASLPAPRLLEYYENVLGFNAVELNFTYYRMPVPRTLESMLRRTRPGFIFVVRSHREMTHEIFADDSRSRLKDTRDAFSLFRAGIAPLNDAGRLGCVLLQFPVYFVRSPATCDYLAGLPAMIPAVRLVVEFRNRSWLCEETFELLQRLGIGYCVVDEPKLPRLVPFVPRLTSEVAYFRFHGRNRNWFNADRSQRYNYRYSEAELAEFIPHINSLANAQTTFLFFNNCHAGAAARNALMMKQLLGLVDRLNPQQQQLLEDETVP